MNPDIISELNRMLQIQNEKLEGINDTLNEQLNVSRQISSSSGPTADNLRRSASAASELTSNMQKAQQNVKGFHTNIVSVAKAMGTTLKNSIGMLLTNISTLFEAVQNPFRALIGFIGTAFDMLAKKASEIIQKMYDYAEAVESVRDKFGDLVQNTSKQTLLASKYLGFGEKFNIGYDGAIEKLRKVSELAEGLGSIIDATGKDFQNYVNDVYLLNEGLGFTGQQLKQVGVLSRLSSKDMGGMMKDIERSTNQVGKALGISTKILGKDVGTVLANFKMLGKLTGDYVTQVVKGAAFTRKLGIELNELASLADKFDDFEQGADAAAQLAQGFGLVLDPLKMMQQQDPARRLDEIRRAFMATGRAVETMTRQERGLLAQTSGLSEEQVALALSSKGMSLSYDQVIAQGDTAMRQQKSQAQVMAELSQNIENFILRIREFASPFDAFMSGLEFGFGTAGDFLKFMQKEIVPNFQDIVNYGKMFGATVSKIFFGADANSPLVNLLKETLIFTKDIAASAKNAIMFFTSKNGSIEGAIGTFVDGVASSFQKYFTVGGELFQQFVNQIGRMFLGVFKALPNILKRVSNILLPAIKSITESIRNGGAIKGEFGQITKELWISFKDVLTTLKDEMLQPGRLGSVLLDLGKELAKSFGKLFDDTFTSVDVGVLFVTGGPVFALIGSIVGQFVNFLKGGPGKEILSDGSKQISDVMGSSAGLGGSITTAGEGTGILAGALQKLKDGVIGSLQLGANFLVVSQGIKLLGVAVRDTLLAFLDPLPGRQESFIDVLSGSLKKLESVSFTSMLKGGIILGGIAIAIGSVAFGVQKLFEITSVAMGSIGTAGTIGVMFATALAAGNADTVGEIVGGTISGFIGGIISSLGAVADKISEIDISSILSKMSEASSKIDASKLAGVITFGTSIQKIGEVVTGFGTINQALDGMKPIGEGVIGKLKNWWNPENPENSELLLLEKLSLIFTGEKNIVSTIKNIIENISGAFSDGLGDDFTGPPPIDSFISKIESVGSLSKGIEALSGVLTSFGSINQVLLSFGNKNGTIGIVQEALAGKTIESGVKQLTDGLLMIFPEDPSQFALGKAIKAIVENLSSIAVDIPKEKLEQISSILSPISKFMQDISDLSKVFESSQAGLGVIYSLWGHASAGLFKNINSLLLDSNIGFASLGITQEMSESISQKLQLTFETLGNFFGGNGIAGITKDIADGTLATFVTAIKGTNDLINEINGILTNLDGINIDLAIDKFGKKMNVARKSFAINGGAINVHMTVNLKLQTQKLAEDLVINGYVKGTGEFNDYLVSPKSVQDNAFNLETAITGEGYTADPNAILPDWFTKGQR